MALCGAYQAVAVVAAGLVHRKEPDQCPSHPEVVLHTSAFARMLCIVHRQLEPAWLRRRK
eukprot:6287407-Amphidinium_carterae.1